MISDINVGFEKNTDIDKTDIIICLLAHSSFYCAKKHFQEELKYIIMKPIVFAPFESKIYFALYNKLYLKSI